MSKWINKDLFDKFVEEKKQEEDQKTQKATSRVRDIVWPTPEKGTQDKAKIYEGRFLPDPKGNFYKKIFYHAFKSGEKWVFALCPKTERFDNWCPLCSAVSKLYNGSPADKEAAPSYKRKAKFVSNFYIIDDPRDKEKEDDKAKVNGTVKIYEFPEEIESKLKKTITDVKNGLGYSIFDPGEDGFNFFINVKSTKPTNKNQVWPVYADSEFARRPSALGSDKEIKAILEKAHDLDEYINVSYSISNESLMAILKEEMLWESVKSEWAKHRGATASHETTAPTVTESDDDIPPFEPDTTTRTNVEASAPKSNDSTDEDLLAELDRL